MSTHDTENEFNPTGYQDDYEDNQDTGFQESTLDEETSPDDDSPDSKQTSSDNGNSGGENGSDGGDKDSNNKNSKDGDKKKSSSLPLIIFGVIALILILCAAYFLFGGSSTSKHVAQKQHKQNSAVTQKSKTQDKTNSLTVNDQQQKVQNQSKQEIKREVKQEQNTKIKNNPFNVSSSVVDNNVVDKSVGTNDLSNTNNMPQSPSVNVNVSDKKNGLPTPLNDNFKGLVNEPIIKPTINPLEDSNSSLKSHEEASALNGLPAVPDLSVLNDQETSDQKNNETSNFLDQEQNKIQNQKGMLEQDSSNNHKKTKENLVAENTFADLLAPVKSKVKDIDGRVKDLSRTVAKMKKAMKKLKNHPSKTIVEHKRSSRHSSHNKEKTHKNNSVVVKPYVSNHRDANSHKYDDASDKTSLVWQIAPVSRIIIGGKPHKESNYNYKFDKSHKDMVNKDCPSEIKAIVRGRVWFKTTDGSFKSYGAGDTWLNGKTIQAVNPKKGIKIAGHWLCHK